MMIHVLVVLALISFFRNSVDGYKPVIIIHGLFDRATSMNQLVQYINQTHPGTKVHNIDLFDDLNSLTALEKQLETTKNVVRSIMLSSPEGVHLIAFSQGGLVARGIVQTMDDHNVHNFISLSSPLNGQYGDTSVINHFLPGYLKSDLYKVFYTESGQFVSIANYWKDPHHVTEYESYSAYLAPLNNESRSRQFFPSWQTNMKKLDNFVMIGGPDDGVITPWQSAHLGCYDSNEKVIDVKNLTIYKHDVFGLQSLDKERKLHRVTVRNVTHFKWHSNKTVFQNHIEPWLT